MYVLHCRDVFQYRVEVGAGWPAAIKATDINQCYLMLMMISSLLLLLLLLIIAMIVSVIAMIIVKEKGLQTILVVDIG